jgi:hypothetical protein
MSLQATIPSSVNQRLACLAERIHSAGPDVLLRMMRAAQLTSPSAIDLFESFGAATLPVPSLPAPSRVINASSRFQTVRQ